MNIACLEKFCTRVRGQNASKLSLNGPKIDVFDAYPKMVKYFYLIFSPKVKQDKHFMNWFLLVEYQFVVDDVGYLLNKIVIGV